MWRFVFRKCDVVNRGLSGYNSRWAKIVLPRLLSHEDSVNNIAAVTIFFGANDCALEGTYPSKLHWRFGRFKKLSLHLTSAPVSQTKFQNSMSPYKSIWRTWRRSLRSWLQLESLQTEWSSSPLHLLMSKPGKKSAFWKVALVLSYCCIFMQTVLYSEAMRDVSYLLQEVLSIVSTLSPGSMHRHVCRLPLNVVLMYWTCGHSCRKMDRWIAWTL